MAATLCVPLRAAETPASAEPIRDVVIYGGTSGAVVAAVRAAMLSARVVIVSPSLLMMAVQVTQALVRDAKMREQAHVIQGEVRLLMQDIRRLGERVGRLDQHFRQTQKDVEEITVSTAKLVRRGERIEQVEVGELATEAAQAPVLSLAE